MPRIYGESQDFKPEDELIKLLQVNDEDVHGCERSPSIQAVPLNRSAD
jgi:hypothetical protein